MVGIDKFCGRKLKVLLRCLEMVLLVRAVAWDSLSLSVVWRDKPDKSSKI